MSNTKSVTPSQLIAAVKVQSPEVAAHLLNLVQYSDDAKQAAHEIMQLFGTCDVPPAAGDNITKRVHDHILELEGADVDDDSAEYMVAHMIIEGRVQAQIEGKTVSDNTILDALTIVDAITYLALSDNTGLLKQLADAVEYEALLSTPTTRSTSKTLH